MRRLARQRAFTLIELLVVVAIIALLLSILLPSLSGAREQGKRAKCLANMSSLGKAMWQYAGEDSVEQTIPIHENMLKSVTGVTNPIWVWRHVNWQAGWGGKSADQIYYVSTGFGYLLDKLEPDQTPPDNANVLPEYDAAARPLNIYMLGQGNIGRNDEKKLEYFGCPSDTGYPDDPDIDDAPRENATRSLYATMGNSYRASFAMFGIGGIFAGPLSGAFSRGPWGTRISTLIDTSRLVWVGEPTWFNMIGRDDDTGIGEEVDVFGWHKRKLQDQLLFVDGSARGTVAEAENKFDETTFAKMNVYGSFDDPVLGRHGTVRLDTYPVGGARIYGNWSATIAQAAGKWPFGAYQDNLGRP